MNKSIEILIQVLHDSMNPDPRNPQSIIDATNKIQQMEMKNGYPLIMMQVIGRKDIPVEIRQQASTLFMKYVKTHWERNIEQSIISENEKNIIKNNIVSLVLSVPSGICLNQVSESIRIISLYDYPSKWPNLLQTLLKRVKEFSSDLTTLCGVLQCLHLVLERYRDRVLDYDLADELNKVIDLTGPYLKNLFQIFVEKKDVIFQSNDWKLIELYIKAFGFVLDIFASLTNLDIQEFFEDNIGFFMKCLAVALNMYLPPQAPKKLHSLLDQNKTNVCSIITIFMGKYDSDFTTYAKEFVNSICSLLEKLSKTKRMMDEEYNPLITQAFKFLTTVSSGIAKKVFQDVQLVKSIITFVVIPNVYLQRTDVENFFNDQTQYIQMNIEGSDSYTRRKAAVDLLNGLKNFDEEMVTNMVLREVQSLLQQYNSNSNDENGYRLKDAAINLMQAISIVAKTRRDGVTDINQRVGVPNFFMSYLFPELQSNNTNIGTNLILVSDCLKFLTLFRMHLITHENFETIFSVILKWIPSTHKVVSTYACWALERTLSIYERQNSRPRFSAENISKFCNVIFSGLFKCVHSDGGNEYAMRGILRVTSMLKEHLGEIYGQYIAGLKNVLINSTKTLSNPRMNHYLFESLSTSIHYNVRSIFIFEREIFPQFSVIIEQQVDEFTPYVFQIIRQLLDLRKKNNLLQNLPSFYQEIFKRFLRIEFWKNTGNIPGLVGLIGTYSMILPNLILEKNNFAQILTYFRSLVERKRLDHEGFYILNELIFNLPSNQMHEPMPQVFRILFQRMSNNRTEKFVRCFIIFLSVLILKFNAGLFAKWISDVEKVDQRKWLDLVFNLWFQNIHDVQEAKSRKICSMGMVKLFCELSSNPNIPNQTLHACILNLVLFLEVERKKVTFLTPKEMEEFKENMNLERAQFSGKFVELKHAKRREVDFTSGIKDSKVFLAQNIQKLLSQNQNIRNRVIGVIKNNDPKVYQTLSEYFRRARMDMNF